MTGGASTHHGRVKEAFAEARELAPADRSRFLESLDRSSPEICSEVRSLLEFDASQEDLLEKGAPARLGDTAEPVPLEPGFRLAGRYEVLRHHASGGMGEVYQAHDELLETTVALKRLRFPTLQSKRRLIEEVLHARRVSHPAVCRVFDIGEAEEGVFLTMEYVDGVDLKKRLADRGPMSETDVLRLARRLLGGLEAAHDAGVVHRDLKPANVLFAEDGEALLTDFGIAVSLSRAEPASMIGTPGYLAPETVPPNPRFSERSDLYSLGLVLREALTGKPALSAADSPSLFALLRHPSFQPLEVSHPEVDPRLRRVIDWSLTPDWRQRAASARQLLEVLETDPGEVEVPAVRPPAAGRFEELTGLGGNAVRRTRVCRALDRLTGSVVALKTYGGSARRTGFLGRVDPARLAGHPNLLSMLDVIDVGGRTLVATPLLEGAEPLVAWAEERSMAERCEALAQMYEGLAFLHTRDQVHGNLRPTNVLVVERRTLLLDALSWQPRSTGDEGPGRAAGERPPGKIGPVDDLEAAREIAAQALVSRSRRRRVSAERTDALLDQLDRALDGPSQGAWAAAVALRRPVADQRPAPETGVDISRSGESGETRSFDTRPLVGREAEIARCEALFGRAATGLGSILRLVGESGVGKTRLVEELRRRAWMRGMLVAQSQVQWARSDAYSAWRLAVARMALEVPLDDDEVRILELVDPDLGERLGRRADLPRRPSDGVPQDVLFPLVLDLMGRLPAPALVILEDLHWADGGSLELMRWLGERDLRAKAVVVGTFRPEETDHHVDLSALESLELSPLGASDSNRLAALVLDARHRLTPDVEARLAREAEGNPLLLLEGLREMVAWAGSGKLDSAALEMPEPTPAVRDALTRRLESLDEEVAWLLLRAAVMGRDIEPGVLAEVAAPRMTDEAMQAALEAAREAWVLHAQSDGSLRFRHDKLREILEERAEAHELREVHAGLAAVLARQRHPTAQIAFHALRSGNRELARETSQEAGLMAMNRGSYLDAIGWLGEALRLQEELGGPVRERGRLRHSRAVCLYALGQVPKAREELEKVILELGEQRIYGGRRPRLPLAVDLCRLWPAYRALRRGDAPADPLLTEICHAYRLLSETCWFENDAIGLLGNGVRAFILAAGTQAPSPAATSSAVLAYLLNSIPGLSPKPFSDLTLDLLKRGPAAPDDVMSVGAIASIFMSRGDWERARPLQDRAVRIGEEAGNERRWGQGIAYRCLLATLTGDWPMVRRIADALTESGQRRGDVQVESWGATYLAEVALNEGRFQRARAYAQRARDLIVEVDKPERIRAEAQLAISSALSGDTPAAWRWVQCVIQGFDGRVTTLHSHASAVHLAAATVELLAADPDDAEKLAATRHAVKALAAFSRRYPMTRPYLEMTRARVAHLAGRPGRARRWLAKAERTSRRLAFASAIDAVEKTREQLTGEQLTA